MGRLFNSKQFRNDLSLSGSFSGSFQGDGSSLTNIGGGIPAISASYAITASYAADSDLLDGKDSTTFTSTSSFNSFTSSYYIDSASYDTRITNNSSSISALSSSYLLSSASFSNDILINSASISYLSSSFVTFSGSYNTGSFTGSFIGNGSGLVGIISSSFATTASYALYAVSASHEIIKEVSSSYADTASFAQSGNGIFSGSFSGSYVGDGSGLTDIPASGIVGLNLSQIASGSATASISPNKGFEINADTKITGSLIVSGSNHTFTGSLSIHSTGTPGLRITSNNDSFEEVKIYDGKITIEDSGQDLATLSSNNTANRLGVLELSNWTTATNGVYLNGYHTGNYANWIGGALIVGRAYTPSSFQHHVALDVTGSAVITGSLTVTDGISGSFSGSFVGDGSQLTGIVSSSYALTASYVETAQTASYILNAVSSSYASTSSYAFYAVSASHEIIKEVSSSYADTASFAQSGNGVFSGSFSGSYVGNGSQLNGIIPPSGRFGIADVSGSYTYYSNLSSSLAAAIAGDTIQLFTNHTEASDHTFHLKDKVDFNFNGNELFISASATLDAADMITDNDTAVSCSFYNGRIRFSQNQSSGIFNRLLFLDNTSSEITSIGFEWEVENGHNSTPFYPIRNDGTLNGGKFIGGSVFNYLIQTYGQLKNLDVYASKGILFNGYLKKHYNLKVHTYGGQAGVESSQNYLYNSYFHAETGQALSIYYAINCDIRADNGAGISGTRQLIDSTVVNSNGIGVSSVGEMIGGSIYTSNNISLVTSIGEILGVTIYNRDYLGPGITMGNGEISNCAIIDDWPANGQKSIQVDSGATSPTITNCSFDFYNNSTNNTAITAVDDDTPVYFANNTFKNCTPTNPTKVTQAIINVPDQQGNITISSSLDNNRTYSGSFSGSYVGDGSGLTGITSGIFHQTGSYYATTNALQITGSLLVTGSITGVQGVINSLTASYSITSSHAVTASFVDIESLPLINPIVKYYNVTEITSSGTIVPLPDSLTYVSSSVYEYLEVFINGLRLRYDMDFLPTSNTTIKYLVSIPAGSEITYKSLKRP